MGAATAAVVRWQMEHRAHPEQGYRSCLGLMRLGREYGADRLEAACARAQSIRSPSYKSIASILSCGLDCVRWRPPFPCRPACRCTRTCAGQATTTEKPKHGSETEKEQPCSTNTP